METNNTELLQFMRNLTNFMDEIKAEARKEQSRVERERDPYQSEQTNDLIAALAKAQADYPSIGNNRTNPFFKSEYADYDSIMCSIRPLLAKNGLVLNQYTSIDDEKATRTLHTRLCHSSGQWMESRERIIPEKNDDQKWASTVTFKKRHQAMALLNITIDRDKYDDDAESNVQQSRMDDRRGTAPNYTYQPSEQPYETVNALEYSELEKALKGWPDLATAIMKSYKISSLAELPRARYALVIQKVRENIEQRKTGESK
jgi:hypothetical protein